MLEERSEFREGYAEIGDIRLHYVEAGDGPLIVWSLPEAIVHANNWHYARHFLHDASPVYTPEEIDRYIEAWSQPGQQAG